MKTEHGVYTIDGKAVGRHTTKVVMTENDPVAKDLMDLLRTAVSSHGGHPDRITTMSVAADLVPNEAGKREWKLRMTGEWT